MAVSVQNKKWIKIAIYSKKNAVNSINLSQNKLLVTHKYDITVKLGVACHLLKD